MATPPTPPADRGDRWSRLLDLATSRLGKVSALVVLVGGLLASGQGLVERVKSWLPTPREAQAPSAGSCFRSQITVPSSVLFGEWPKQKFLLVGQNNCADDLQVEVMFSGASDGRMQIEPPYGSEWLVTSIDRGEVRLEISPPRLTRMVDRMANPVKISLNWKIRDASTQRVLRAGEAGIEIRDDPA